MQLQERVDVQMCICPEGLHVRRQLALTFLMWKLDRVQQRGNCQKEEQRSCQSRVSCQLPATESYFWAEFPEPSLESSQHQLKATVRIMDMPQCRAPGQTLVQNTQPFSCQDHSVFLNNRLEKCSYYLHYCFLSTDPIVHKKVQSFFETEGQVKKISNISTE